VFLVESGKNDASLGVIFTVTVSHNRKLVTVSQFPPLTSFDGNRTIEPDPHGLCLPLKYLPSGKLDGCSKYMLNLN
jgi:hypothetical protein